VLNRRTAFDLLALHSFDEQFFEELIDESRIDTCDPTRPQSSAILQDVLAYHLDASLMNAALAGAQRLKSLGRLLGPRLRHRLKNLLTVTNSVCASSVKHGGSKEDISRNIAGRIQAIANAQDLLSIDPSRRSDLGNLMQAIVGPLCPGSCGIL
jgi:two-component sensor histidine kinase